MDTEEDLGIELVDLVYQKEDFLVFLVNIHGSKGR